MSESLYKRLAESMVSGARYDQLHTLAAQEYQRDLLTTLVGPEGDTQVVGPLVSHGQKFSIKRGFAEALNRMGLSRPIPEARPLYCPDVTGHAGMFKKSELLRKLAANGYQWLYLLPLRVENRALGWLYVLSRDERRLEDAEGEAWRGIAALLALAMDRERLESRVRAESRWRDTLRSERDWLASQEDAPREPIGKSAVWLRARTLAQTAATSTAPVLLTGSTGTGKEVLARWIHHTSPRKRGPFVALNCGALSSTLAGSELFGHERGAFTGADKLRLGLVEIARGGTLFLDEIGEMPADLQVQLLRFLESGEFRRVGGNQTLKADVRIVSATNRALEKTETFRRDLFFRLNVLPIRLPSLAERPADIALFVDAFVKEFAEKQGRTLVVAQDTYRLCREYEWPGNIRELRNLVERNMLFCTSTFFRMNPLSDVLSVRAHNPASYSKPPEPVEYPDGFDQAARIHILRVLKKAGGRLYGWQGGADRLKLKPSTLQGKLKKLKIKREEYERPA